MSDSRVEELPDDFDEQKLSESPDTRRKREVEEDMSSEDVSEVAALRLKKNGNEYFQAGQLDKALQAYEHAAKRLPWKPRETPKKEKNNSEKTPPKDGPDQVEDVHTSNDEEEQRDYTLLSQVLCNAGFILQKQQKYDEAIGFLNDAIHHDEGYSKAYFRRATCHFEAQHWAQAVADYDQCSKLNLPLDADARQKSAHAKAKHDEEMQKMWGQLKDMGNMFLGKFGLSTDNFKFEQDPKSGGYTMNFVQNPPPPAQK